MTLSRIATKCSHRGLYLLEEATDFDIIFASRAQWNLDIVKDQGLAKYVHYNEVWLHWGSFPYILQ